jgi:hypothetical protein
MTVDICSSSAITLIVTFLPHESAPEIAAWNPAPQFIILPQPFGR